MKLIILTIVSVFLVGIKPVLAQKFKLQDSSISLKNIADTNTVGLGSRLNDEQLIEFNHQGYVVIPGYSYLEKITPVTLTVEDVTVEFSDLGKKNIVENSTKIFVDGAAGFYLLASQDGPLTSSAGTAIIPDTKCNGRNQTCTEFDSAIWDNDKTGFGYSLDSPFAFGFPSKYHFRPFSDIQAKEKPSVIMKAHFNSSGEKTLINRYSGRLKLKIISETDKLEETFQTIINLQAQSPK